MICFALTYQLLEWHKHVGNTQIPVVLRNLILKDEVVSKGIPGQFAEEPMILVSIVASMGEDQIGRNRRFQFLKDALYALAMVRHKPVSKLVKVQCPDM